MKNALKVFRILLTALLITIGSQVAVFAESNEITNSPSGLSAGQVVGGFVLLVAGLLLPLVKKRTPSIAHK